MDEMKEAVGNWREAKQFSPADENDFLRWLDKADTEEKLFSRLTFWFTFRGLPADQNQRYHLVQERARELGFYIQKYCGCVFSEEERYLKKSKIIP